MMKYVIDRFEGIYAVCEDDSKAIFKIPKYKLPLGCKEGDFLIQDSDGMYQIMKENKKTAENKIKDKMNRLFE